MSGNLFNLSPLLQQLHSNQIILTPNSRLRRIVIDAYNHHCSNFGQTVWQAPRVYAYSEWIKELYQLLLDRALIENPKVIANDHQLQQIWLKIIAADDRGAELVNPLRLANDAVSAVKSLQRWRLSSDDLSQHTDPDNMLLRWLKDYHERLSEMGFCTHEEAQESIISACLQGDLRREDHITLLGFEQPAPLPNMVFKTLSHSFSHQAALQRRQADSCFLANCSSTEDEIEAAALWALDCLQKNPGSSIGIISPDLGQSRDIIERVFIKVFEPHYSLPETPRYTLPFNFSAGTPMGKMPLVHDTLELLKLNLLQWSVEKLIDILNSPFWMISNDSELQQKVIGAIGIHNRETIRTASLRALCHQLAGLSQPDNQAVAQDEPKTQNSTQILDLSLQRFESLRQQRASMLMPSRWAELFEQQLRTLSWPGPRRLDSNEFQQMNHWYQLLEEFSFFDQSQGAVNCSQALELLSQLAMSTPYQAQTPQSPIQILGILEGAGIEFDFCWILGMSQTNWPPSPEPNPLLPLALQREEGMPHADANRELLYAEQLTSNYRRCAASVIFSYSNFEDGTASEPSSLINDLQQICPSEQSWYRENEWHKYSYGQLSFNSFQWVNCTTAPAVSDEELSHLRGGSQIIKDQAILPVAAFLYHRLGAEKEKTLFTGLSPMQRGQILHDSLADIWNKLQDHETLTLTSKDFLMQWVTEAVTEHVESIRNRESLVLGPHYMALEIQRQTRLILDWLEYEKTRPPFTVKAIEQTLKLEFNGLPLTLRLDRLDQLKNGEWILIDYKTGRPSAKSWSGSRPEEPQLPLYALCYHQQVDAVMFAQINTESIQTIGLGQLNTAHDGFLTTAQITKLDLPEQWPDIRQFWQTTLTTITEEFLHGDCSYQLSSPSQQRFYQHLEPLLRGAEEDEIIQALPGKPEFNQ